MESAKSFLLNVVGPYSAKKEEIKNAFENAGYKRVKYTTSSLKTKLGKGGKNYNFKTVRKIKNSLGDYIACSEEKGFHLAISKKELQGNCLTEMDYEMTFQCFAIPDHDVMVITVYLQTHKEIVLEKISKKGVENITILDTADYEYQGALKDLADLVICVDEKEIGKIFTEIKDFISCFELKECFVQNTKGEKYA